MTKVIALVIRESGVRKGADLFSDARYPLADGFDAPLNAVVQLTLTGDTVESCETLALPRAARSELYRLCAQHGLNPLYPSAVLDQVNGFLDDPGIDDPTLEDLTDLPFITIDNAGSRDLDQAIYIDDNGQLTLHYALADASYYVRPNEPLFVEALSRGATYYLPTFAIPMLPPQLSEGLVSLNPDVERRSLVVSIALDESGQVLSTRFRRARMRSRAKLTYEGVQAFLDEPKKSPLADQPFTSVLLRLKRMGQILIARARRRGIVEYNRHENEVAIEDDRFVVRTRARNDVEKYNERLSLLTNIVGAQFLEDAPSPDVQPIFRVHDAPSPRRIEEMRTRIAGMVRAHQLDAAWLWNEKSETVGDYLDRLRALSAHPTILRAIERQAIVINNRSEYSSQPGAHHGIGAAEYARFSSPMREMVGIFVHKEALEKLGTTKSTTSNAEDEALRTQVIDAGHRAKSLQKRLNKEIFKMAIDQLFEADLRADVPRIHPATILGFTTRKLYVLLDNPALEVKFYVEEMGLTGPKLTDGRAVLQTNERRFLIGERIRFRVLRHDSERQRWCFAVLDD